MLRKISAPLCALLLIFMSGCDDSDNDNPALIDMDTSDQFVQHIGETLVSIDESGGDVSGTIEAACSGVSFGVCGATSDNTRVKSYNGCTIGNGLGAVSGTVTLTFAGSAAEMCEIPEVNDSVTRVPALSGQLLAGVGTFTIMPVSGSVGQVITRTASSTFTFSDAGVRRTMNDSNGNIISDTSTQTTSPITITGAARAGRTINGGALQITDHQNNQTCNLIPNGVTWTSGSCNCPTSGTLSGTCSTGEPISVAFTSSCGSVNTSFGSTSKTVMLDRCE